jgi:predicted small secreted protein
MRRPLSILVLVCLMILAGCGGSAGTGETTTDDISSTSAGTTTSTATSLSASTTAGSEPDLHARNDFDSVTFALTLDCYGNVDGNSYRAIDHKPDTDSDTDRNSDGDFDRDGNGDRDQYCDDLDDI